MANIISSAPVLVKEQIKSISEAAFLKAFVNPDLNQFHSFQTGIKGQREIIILNEYFTGLSGQIKTDCDTTADSLTVASSTKTWDPKYISGRITECFDKLMGKFLQWGLKNGLKKEDLTDTDFANFIEGLMPNLLTETVMRLAYFGDTALVADTSNSVVAGNVKYFTPIDGFWKQILAIVAGDATKRVTLAKNAEATFVLQAFNSTDLTNKVVTSAFDSAWYGADMRLRGLPKSELAFICTQTMVDQYEKERKSVTGIDLPYERVENGIDVLKYNGIDVIPFQFLDRMINAYFQNDTTTATAWVNPHRGFLVPKWLLTIGTEDVANLMEFDVFYDKRAKEYIIDYGFNIDAKIVLNPMIMSIY